MKVMKKSNKLQHYEGPNGTMTYFHIIGAVGNITQLFKVYKSAEFEKVLVGMTYVFQNVVTKSDNTVFVVAGSKMMMSNSVEVEDDLSIPLLPEEEPPAGAKRTLKEALGSPVKSTICAKVVKVSPLKYRLDGTLPVRSLGLKDSSGYGKVVCFAEAAESSYEPNTTVEISGLYAKTWKKQAQLNFSRTSTCQFIQASEVDVLITPRDEEHFLKDDDFAVTEREEVQDLVLDGIYEATSYDACTNEACHKKKIIDSVCPTCQGDAGMWTYRAKVSITGDNIDKEVVLFFDNLQKLFGATEQRSDEALVRWMVQSLPIAFSAKVIGNNLYRIEKK